MFNVYSQNGRKLKCISFRFSVLTKPFKHEY